MAEVYKILGQSAPAATTNTDVYTVPSNTQVVVSSIVVCNRSSTSTTFRIAIRPNGETLANSHYVAYDTTIEANDIVSLTLGVTIDSADIITVYAGNDNLTFSFFGTEIS